MGEQRTDGVVERVCGPAPRRVVRPQLNIGHRRLPPVQQRFVEQEEMSADPERDGRRRRQESGQNLDIKRSGNVIIRNSYFPLMQVIRRSTEVLT